MPVYLIAEVKVNDDSWVPEYAARVHEIAERHGGRYLSRSGNITALEGDPPHADVVALIQFPSVDAARAFADDPEYAPFAEARKAGTDSRLFVIDDTDLAGGVPYLPKA